MSARCSPDRCQELIQRLRNQFLVARWLGEQAVGVVRRELAEAWEAGRTSSRTADSPLPEAITDEPALDEQVIDDTVATQSAGDESAVAGSPAGEATIATAVVLADVLAAAAHAEQLDPDELPATVGRAPAVPFDGYDTLPASHIVQRLRRMTPDELRGAASYEASHRNRSTVLGMVDQLLGS